MSSATPHPSPFWSFLETQIFRPMVSVSPKGKGGMGPGVSQSQGFWSSVANLSAPPLQLHKSIPNAPSQAHLDSGHHCLYRNRLSA